MRSKSKNFIFYTSFFLFFHTGVLYAEDESVLQIPVTRQDNDGKISVTIETIQPGASEDDVLAVLGVPDRKSFKGRIWHYQQNKLHIRLDKDNKVMTWQEEFAAECPVCRKPMKILPVIYGHPTADLVKLSEKNEIIYGGMYWTKVSPLWAFRCAECDKNYSVKDSLTRLHLEIEKSLKYRPPGISEEKFKKTKHFSDQLRVDREKDEW